MTKNYITLELGGKQRGLKFNNRTINCIGELTNADPLQFAANGKGWADLMNYTGTILHAALLSNCASKKEEPDFTADNIKEWIDELEPSQIYFLVDMFKNSLNPSIVSANGEVGKDTQPGATEVAAL